MKDWLTVLWPGVDRLAADRFTTDWFTADWFTTDWFAQLGQLPAPQVAAVLGVVMVLDAVPLLGVLVPGDVAVLAAVGVGQPYAGPGAFLAVIAGCLTGWSMSFYAGRWFGARLRQGRIGAWIGPVRWATAEAMLRQGGGRMVLVAPFLPVLNALMPLAAGGLKMSYGRFVSCAALGAGLWAGLYVLLGLAGRALSDQLYGGAFATLGTVAVGLAIGGLIMFSLRRRLRLPKA